MTKKLPPQYTRTLQMLTRKRGATADEIVAEFGIQRHTARAIVCLTAKAAEVTVERDKETGRYRVAR